MSERITLTEAASRSDREFLEALRDHLAATLDSAPPPHVIAGLTKQLMEVRKELAIIESADGDDRIGEAVSVPDADFDPSSL